MDILEYFHGLILTISFPSIFLKYFDRGHILQRKADIHAGVGISPVQSLLHTQRSIFRMEMTSSRLSCCKKKVLILNILEDVTVKRDLNQL